MYLLIRLCVFSILALTSLGAESPPWFNHGIGPIFVGQHDGIDLSAKSCQGCHTEVYEQWSHSSHGKAWSNPHFQEGFLVEHQQRCVYCHAPLNEQLQDFISGKDSELLSEGVNCASCHIRRGAIWHSGHNSDILHPLRGSRKLSSARFCAGCHQFNLDHTENGDSRIVDLNAQNTFAEWETYRQRGGQQTCQGCHMPGGSHKFLGSRNVELMRSALRVTALRSKVNEVEFRVASVNVGHNFPTGDVFRHIRLEISENEGASFREVYRFGKRYGTELNEWTGDLRQRLQENTAIEPMREKTIKVRAPGPIHFRFRYFYVSDKGFRNSHLPDSDLVLILRQGVVE